MARVRKLHTPDLRCVPSLAYCAYPSCSWTGPSVVEEASARLRQIQGAFLPSTGKTSSRVHTTDVVSYVLASRCHEPVLLCGRSFHEIQRVSRYISPAYPFYSSYVLSCTPSHPKSSQRELHINCAVSLSTLRLFSCTI